MTKDEIDMSDLALPSKKRWNVSNLNFGLTCKKPGCGKPIHGNCKSGYCPEHSFGRHYERAKKTKGVKR